MGAHTIESRLRWRLLAVIAPALAGVGVAAVAVTAYVLDAADRSAAMERAEAALHALVAERDEGDSFETAAGEVLAGADVDGLRMAVRIHEPDAWRGGVLALPAALLSVKRGGCETARDERGEPWQGCMLQEAGYDVAVAVPIRAHRSLIWTLARAMSLVVAATLLGVIWATRRAMRAPMESLARLVRWAEAVGDDGAPPLPQSDTDDLERLASSFDRLVRRLVEALTRERANSAHIAHELRTPLTAIRAELEALPSSPGVDRARADVARLERVVEAILVLSAPREGGRHASVVNVADLVREQVSKETAVEAPDEALVEGDSRLVSLALHNLLENAMKYSGRAARTVRVSREEGYARVAVIDDGPGLDSAARGRMFDRYWRATSDDGGHGLGLALVRAVAERHGGKAEAVPNRAGRGLEVAMTLGPVVAWHEPA
jgi:signal transduction histidine kinase